MKKEDLIVKYDELKAEGKNHSQIMTIQFWKKISGLYIFFMVYHLYDCTSKKSPTMLLIFLIFCFSKIFFLFNFSDL